MSIKNLFRKIFKPKYSQHSITRNTMNLKRFITQSLVEIMTGLKDAQEQLKDSHARICPILSESITPGGQNKLIGLTANKRAIDLIEYDVAIEVSTEGANAEIKVAALGIGLGANQQIMDAQKYVSRIKFSVPVCYPERGEG